MSCYAHDHHWSWADAETPPDTLCDCGAKKFCDQGKEQQMQVPTKTILTSSPTPWCDSKCHVYYKAEPFEPCACGARMWPGKIGEVSLTPKADFITKDSGERQEFSTGMVRDVQTNKPRYDLIGSGWDLITRWAELMARGAIKYGEFNFEKAATEEELKRFKASALRHMIQWSRGETDEDHAAAVCFNVAGAEMVAKKLRNK